MGINRFYCCGKLASVTITYASADNAGTKTVNNKSCCKNEIKSFKVKDSHFNAVPISLKFPASADIPYFTVAQYKLVATLLNAALPYNSHAPPDRAIIPAYTLNCTYRI